MQEIHISDAPVRLFSVSDFGLSVDEFLAEFSPSFDDLEPDYYDVKRRQIEWLKSKFPTYSEALNAQIPAFYADQATLDDLLGCLPEVEVKDHEVLGQFTPFRRRRIAKFNLTPGDNGWGIAEQSIPSFKQATSDIRAVDRIFSSMKSDVIQHASYQAILEGVANLVKSVHPNPIRGLNFIAHQMSVEARTDDSATNAPEGIHQDGADYVVTALVIERLNITGGVSQLYGPEKREVLFSKELQPGEGLFHADEGSDIWHDVSPIRLAQPGSLGHRNIFGFDIMVDG